jgi:hypothetical protein
MLLEHIQFHRKLNALQLSCVSSLAFVAFSNGKPDSTFPENAPVRLSHFRTENRIPSRIKSGAGIFLKMHLASITSIAIRIPITHAATHAALAGATSAGGVRALLAGRKPGGAGLTGPAAFLLHPLARYVGRGSGLGGHRSSVLHALPRCVLLRPALCMAERGGRDQQARCSDDR